MKKGLVQIYFGNGKGKTTAAIGLIIRQLAYKKKVLLVQFMKNPQDQFDQFGEISVLNNFKNIKIKQFGLKDWVLKNKISPVIKKEFLSAFNFLQKQLISKEFDLVVGDELLYAIDLGFLEEKDIINLIKKKPSFVELVLTGSHKNNKKILAVADYVTKFKKIKHPFDKGVIARKSIEF